MTSEDIKARYADLRGKGVTALRSTEWEGERLLGELELEDLERLLRSGPWRAIPLTLGKDQ